MENKWQEKAKEYQEGKYSFLNGKGMGKDIQNVYVEAATLAENEMKEKAIEAYKRNCRLYQPTCLEGNKRPCTGGCEYLADFITELNKQ